MPNFLKDILEKNNFSLEEVAEEVLLVKDFLSQEELQEFYTIIDSTEDDEWFIEYLSNLKNFCMQKFGRDDVENLVAEGKFEITQNWNDKNLNISRYPFQKIFFNRLNDLIQEVDDSIELSGFATIQRMQEGVKLTEHTDQHTDPSIQYAAIIYLNDDYVDGELFFQKKGIELKPKAGSLMLFPGNEEYEHGVRYVGPGPIRYVLVGFIKIKNFYANNKY